MSEARVKRDRRALKVRELCARVRRDRRALKVRKLCLPTVEAARGDFEQVHARLASADVSCTLLARTQHLEVGGAVDASSVIAQEASFGACTSASLGVGNLHAQYATVATENVEALTASQATCTTLSVTQHADAQTLEVPGTAHVADLTADTLVASQADVNVLGATEAALQTLNVQTLNVQKQAWAQGAITLQGAPLVSNENPPGLYYMHTAGAPYIEEKWTAKLGGEEQTFSSDTQSIRAVGSDLNGFVELKILAINGDPDYVQGTFYLRGPFSNVHAAESKEGNDQQLRMNVTVTVNAYSAAEPGKNCPFAGPTVQWAGALPDGRLAVRLYWMPATRQKTDPAIKGLTDLIKDIPWEAALAAEAAGSPDGAELPATQDPTPAAWECATDAQILSYTNMSPAGKASEGTLYFSADGSLYNCLRFTYNISFHDGAYR